VGQTAPGPEPNCFENRRFGRLTFNSESRWLFLTLLQSLTNEEMKGRMSKGSPPLPNFGVYWLGPRVPKLLQPCSFSFGPTFWGISLPGEVTLNRDFLFFIFFEGGGGFHETFLVLIVASSNLPSHGQSNLDMGSFVINFVPSKFQSVFSFGGEFFFFFFLTWKIWFQPIQRIFPWKNEKKNPKFR
jgi:hypothetical protein